MLKTPRSDWATEDTWRLTVGQCFVFTCLVLAPDPGVDGGHQDDAEDHRQDGRGEVVGDGPQTNLA